MLFLFLPTSTFISCPLFKLDISWMNRIITILYSFYFALDPFPIIYLVDEYRKAVLGNIELSRENYKLKNSGFFRYIRRNHQVSSVIMNVSNLEWANIIIFSKFSASLNESNMMNQYILWKKNVISTFYYVTTK